MRRAGHLLAGRDLTEAQLERLGAVLDDWCAEVADAPVRDKRQFMLARGGMAEFLRTGVPQPPPADGDELAFDEVSFIGGPSSGLSMGFTYRREGDDAVAETVFDRGFEGPPERVHGGAVAAAIDESMSLVLLFVGQPAYTVRLTISFRAPAPLHRPVRFRSRLVQREGRKLFIRCEASSDEGVFAEADGLFVLAPPPEQPEA
jgi:acyl-coenzyme A thioesterase PaaI-like protein